MDKSESKNADDPHDNGSVPTASYGGQGMGPGGQIGPYEILSILGEGGCDMVYLADRSTSIRRVRANHCREWFFRGVGVLSIELWCNQGSQEDRMARETQGISLLKLVIALLLLAAGAARSRPAPAF